MLTTYSATAQFGRQGRQRQNRFNQQPQIAPNENQKEQMEKKNKLRQEEYTASFINSLEADDFQKEITKQTIADYYTQIKKFLTVKFENSVQQKEAFEGFKNQHFAELKTLLSESDNKKLDEFLDGKFKKNDGDKKKKKKRKRKKKNKDDN